jgi:hypothetical protein
MSLAPDGSYRCYEAGRYKVPMPQPALQHHKADVYPAIPEEFS